MTRLQLEYKGEYQGIREMRKHVAWYTKGLHGSARLREQINAVETYQELEKILDIIIAIGYNIENCEI